MWLNEILVCFGAGREGSVLCGSSKCHRAFAGISGIPWADFKVFFASHLLKLKLKVDQGGFVLSEVLKAEIKQLGG